ncbi:MAG TPA: hypothetical protein IAB50_08535 [Candidatus Faecivicinus avistercoris]|nr:hypothetical protein [Candidatus Faecivicinus avistercoris]
MSRDSQYIPRKAKIAPCAREKSLSGACGRRRAGSAAARARGIRVCAMLSMCEGFAFAQLQDSRSRREALKSRNCALRAKKGRMENGEGCQPEPADDRCAAGWARFVFFPSGENFPFDVHK